MKSVVFAAAWAILFSLASAGVVVTPINGDQVVEKISGDCFYGVVTPQGCGPLRKTLEQIEAERAAAVPEVSPA